MGVEVSLGDAWFDRIRLGELTTNNDLQRSTYLEELDNWESSSSYSTPGELLLQPPMPHFVKDLQYI